MQQLHFRTHHISPHWLPSDAAIIQMDTPNSYGLITSAFDRHEDTVLDLKQTFEVHGTV